MAAMRQWISGGREGNGPQVYGERMTPAHGWRSYVPAPMERAREASEDSYETQPRFVHCVGDDAAIFTDRLPAFPFFLREGI